MSDLLITLSAAESKKNGFAVLQTYYTKKVGANKSGKYNGGSISGADASECVSVGNVSCDLIKELFARFCVQLSPNAYYISVANLSELLRAVRSCRLFFLDNTDRSLMLISNVVELECRKKCRYQYQVGERQYSLCGDGTLMIERVCPATSQIKQSDPIPRLCRDQETQTYSLVFDYAGKNVRYSDKQLSIHLEGEICLRSFRFERNIAEQLLEYRFTKLSMGRFLYSGRMNEGELKGVLSPAGIYLEDDKNIVVPKISIRRGESGWFEIGLECDLGGEVLDLASRIDLFATRNTIDINGRRVMLPSSIAEAKSELAREGNKLKIREGNFFRLLHIIYDSGRPISDFYSYSDIKVRIEKPVLDIAYSYQVEGIKWMKFLYLNHLGGCLADDMGLGKTFQVISFLGEKDIKQKIGKVLVVVPKSLLTNWAREFAKFHSPHKVGIYHGDERRSFNFNACDVVITTYNTALLDEQILNRTRYSLAIFDEIQTIKNRNSITSNSMKRINADIKFGLSGTPMENGISELWNILDTLNPGMLSSHDAFLRRYNNRNYDELRTILSLVIMRRTKESVLKELPPKTEEIVFCDMDDGQRKLYLSINAAVKTAIMNMKAFAAPVVLKGLTLLRECCCHPLLLGRETNVDGIAESCKLDSLRILVSNLFESGHKVLIFSGWTSMLRLIKEDMERNDIYNGHIYYLDGKTKNRSEVVSQFELAERGVFLISIKAGGVGLNLVSAQDVVIYDPWWNPFVEQQAVDRAHRIGQNKAVTVYKLVAANTLEERMLDIENTKRQDFDALINGISNDKSLDIETIMRLL